MSLIAAKSTFTPKDPRRARELIVHVKLFAKVRAAQSVVLEEARNHVAVDTGDLKDSIAAGEITDDGNRITGTVVATADHAGYVEFGTGRRGAGSSGAGPFSYNLNWPGMRAQPYMRPALDTARDKVLSEFKK